MKRAIVRFLIFLILLAGAAWLLYPVVSDQLSRGSNDRLMQEYHQAVHGMTAAEMEAKLEEASAYNAELTEEGIPDVFSNQNPKAPRSYQGLLDIRGGVIGELIIPGIHVELPIYHSGSASAENRLVHVAGTALPADQDGTHVVLAGPGVQKAEGFLGDLMLTDARMLEDIERVVPDDLIFLNVLNRTLIFRVEGVQTLSPEGLSGADISGEEGAQLLTLVTERKGRRLLIRSRKVSATEIREQLIEEDRAEIPSDLVNILSLGIPVLLLGMIIMMIVERFVKRKYRLPTETKKRRKNSSADDPDGEDEPKESERISEK